MRDPHQGLVVQGLEVGSVLSDVSLEVAPGTVLAVLGPNGAGKSMLLRALAGLVRPRAGRVSFGGRDLSGLDAAGRVALGVVMVGGVFGGMSVGDNLLVACHRFAWDVDRVAARVDAALDAFPALAGRLEQPAATLSGGEQQMLALAKAFVLEPELLLVDELTLGLAPVAVDRLLGVVRGLREGGTTMVVVEQSVNVALSVADQVAAMEKGRLRSIGAAGPLLAAEDLVETVLLGRRR